MSAPTDIDENVDTIVATKALTPVLDLTGPDDSDTSIHNKGRLTLKGKLRYTKDTVDTLSDVYHKKLNIHTDRSVTRMRNTHSIAEGIANLRHEEFNPHALTKALEI